MDGFLQRARSFACEAAKRSQDLAKEAAKFSQEIALETAKRSQDLAKEAAKISQGIALETAKRSKEIATEASKKADQLKAFAGDITIGIPTTTTTSSTTTTTSSSSSSSSSPSEVELLDYGITSELREFVHGLTISTFQDFPPEDSDCNVNDEVSTSDSRQDLTKWQERHALLLLKAVPEISQFRYDLCPRLMKEKRFWKIYFTLIRSHVVLYEAEAVVPPEDTVRTEHNERASAATSTTNEAVEKSVTLSNANAAEATEEKQRPFDDQDLDTYLLGDPDSDDDGEDGGFDAEFDQFVNSSALDSDIEEEQHDSKMSTLLSAKGSEDSSDGELVGFPLDLDNQTTTTTADEDGDL